MPKAPAGFILFTEDGARQALLNRRRVIDLEAQLKDLTDLMQVKDRHIERQEKVISLYSGAVQASEPVARSDTDKACRCFWPKVGNVILVGVVVFLGYQVMR